jgi:hypothetical protein
VATKADRTAPGAPIRVCVGAVRPHRRMFEVHAADAAFLEHCSPHQFNNLHGDDRPT